MATISTPVLMAIYVLFCILGVVHLFYKAVRAFIAKKFWTGFRSLIFMFGFIVLCLIPFTGHDDSELAARSACRIYLFEIKRLIDTYAVDHEGAYPSLLATNTSEFNTYACVDGLSERAPAKAVLAFCLPEHHKGEGAYVMFNNAGIQWFACKPSKDSEGQHMPTFQELTNNPTLFYGTTNEVQLADLRKRTRIIYPQRVKSP